MADTTRISLSVATNADSTTNIIIPHADAVETTYSTGTHSYCATATFTGKKSIR
jgi:hypothetical protein